MSININPQSLDPNIVQLACLVGLFSKNTEDPDGTLTLQTDWFSNPLDHIREIPGQRGAELIQLLESVLGSAAGNALGTPTNTLNRNWYPIRNPATDSEASSDKQDSVEGGGSPRANSVTDATGLYVVTYESKSDAEASPAEDSRIVVGLGLMRPFVKGSLTFTVYAYFPLLELPAADSGYFVLGQSDDPVELGFEITGSDGAFGSGEVAFDGLKVAMEVFFNGDAPRPEIVLLNLRMPGQPKPADVSLIDLVANGPIDRWISLGLSVLAAQLSASPLAASPAGSIEAMVYDIMALLGLVGDVPSFDWEGLRKNPSGIVGLLTNWIKAIAASPDSLKSWLASLHDALAQVESGEAFNSGPVDAVSGSGTRTDPWATELVRLGDEIALSFTVATVTETNGNLSLYPGISIESKVFQPVSELSRLGVRGVAAVELVQMILPAQGPPTSTLFPLFELNVSLLNPMGGPLFAVDDPLSGSALNADHASPVEGGAVKKNGFSIEAIAFALSYSGFSTGEVPSPTFTFTNVNTALGSWAEITLADFDNPVKLAENLITTIVQNALDNFLGAGGDKADDFAESLAVVLGVSAPPEYKGQWPVDVMLINTPGALDALVANPLGALGGYYSRCLTTLDGDGQPVWRYLLQHLSNLLGGALSMPVGSGVAEDPWQIPLISLGKDRPGAYLQAWQAVSSPVAQPELHLALFFGVPINIPIHSSQLDHVVADVGLAVELLSLRLPVDGSTSFGAAWLRGAALEMIVRGATADNTQTNLVTPQLAGVSIQADDIMVAAGWRREDGFYWETEIAKAAVGYAQTGTQQPIGTISFSSADSPDRDANVSALAEVFVSMAGLWVLEHGGRFGLTLTAALGLLPTLPAIVNGSPGNYPFELPKGLALPSNWPTLSLSDPSTFFTKPWADLKSQLGQLFSDGAFAEPLLQLLSWAIAGEVPAAPDPQPTGTADDPWFVEFPNLWGLEVLAWSESASGTVRAANVPPAQADVASEAAYAKPASIGFDLRKAVSSGSDSDVRMDAAIRLDIARLKLNGAGESELVSLPRGLLTCDFANPTAGQPLVMDAQSGLRIGSARLGAQFDSDGVTPLLVLYDAQLSASDAPQTFELTRAPGQLPVLTSEQGIEALETLLNELMSRLIESSAAVPSVQAMFEVLEDLGLAQTEIIGGSPGTVVFKGISMGAWDSMLANPVAFFGAQMGTLAQDPLRRGALFEHLSAVFGFGEPQLPQTLKGLPPLLAALGLLQPVSGGYAISLSSWLQFIQHPVQYLEHEASSLLSSADARKQLITALSQLVGVTDAQAPLSSPPSWPIELEVSGGTKVTLKLSEPINLGPELELSGDLVLDMQALSLDTSLVLSSPVAGSALGFRYEMLIGPNGAPVGPCGQAGGDWYFALEAAPGATPAPFDPLRIYPLPADTTSYLVQLGEEVPLFLLSAVASKVLNQYVLPSHPLAVNLFDIFGLTVKYPDGTERVSSLLGIFMHPVDWLLSPEVLGDGNNRLDLNKLGQMMKQAAGSGIHGPDGVTLMPNDAGLTLSGLPYGMQVSLTSDSTDGVSIDLSIEPALNPPAPCVKVDGGLSFGSGAGVSVEGGLTLIFDLTSGASPVESCSPPASDQLLTVNASFNKEEKNAFALQLVAHTGGTDYPVTLLPFQGLNQFIPGAGGTEALLSFIAGKLNDAYRNNQAKISAEYPELDALIKSFISIGNDFGITDIKSLIAAVGEIRSNPLKWLLGPLAPDKVSDTLDSINVILSERLKLPGFSRVNDSPFNAIRYTPGLPSPLGEASLAINFGNRTNGSDTFFGMWVTPQVTKEWLRVDADTGVGVTLPLSGDVKDARFDFTLETSIGIDLRSLNIPLLANGPELSLYLDIENAGKTAYQLKLFPLGNPADGGSTVSGEILYIDLLPTPEFTIESAASPSAPPNHDVLDWLRKFAVNFLLPLIADIALDTEPVKGFLDHPIGATDNDSPASSVTPGIILRNWGLLAEKSPSSTPVAYVLADWAEAFSGTPAEVIQNLIFAALSSFPADFQLLKIRDEGGIYIVSESNDVGGKDYGLRLQVIDLPLNPAPPQNGQAKGGGTGDGGQSTTASPQFFLQLGNWQTDENLSNPWIKRADPGWAAEPLGVSFYLLRMKSSEEAGQHLTPSFYPKLSLVSVGMDVKAAGNVPLVNMKGFRLGGFEPRLYLSLDPEDLSQTIFGASIRCDDIGIPLGPNFGSSTSSNNPVAQNLLASKSDSGESGGGADSGADGGSQAKGSVNPIFSMTASYVREFDFVLHGGQDGDPTGIIWFPVQRSFGPLTCRKIGIGWQGEDAHPKDLLSVAFDGSVSLAGLSVNLMDLTVGVPVRTPTDFDSYVLDLGGLDVSFEGGPVEITGGLLKTYASPYGLEYTGSALIKASTFLISGMGSYAVLDHQPSLFIFVMYDAPIGGPAFFFVTGVSAGFGYNRGLIIPAQDEVQSFPLVAGITDPSVFGGQDPLQVLNKDVPPELGAYWLAAGVQFTSFDLIQSSALLVVEFGREFEIALLGLSTLVLPKAGDGVNPYVYAELSIEVIFKPSTGLLAATMVLTPNSYVLDKDCKLTGGFAFYIWFSGPHKGEFVVTLGGYHPMFTPPDYYPVEPRLGFNWPVSSDILIKGEAYFALTPSCVMAGGKLEATYDSGNLRAWFDAQADFLISWKPFHYDISIEISIGASYTIHFIVTKTFTVELGASVHIWGPRLRGTAHIKWWVISFTVSFGSGDDYSPQPTTIKDWAEFDSYFLKPQQESGQQQQQMLSERRGEAEGVAHAPAAVAPPPPTQVVSTIRAAAGLLGTYTDDKNKTVWIIRADTFVITTQTSVPATQIILTSGPDPTKQTAAIPSDPKQILAIGVRPMNQPTIVTQHIISISKNSEYSDLVNEWSWQTETAGVPAALWDHDANNGNLSPDSKVLPGRIIGIGSGTKNPYTPPPPPPPINILTAFSYAPLAHRLLPLSDWSPPYNPPIQDDASTEIIQNTIMDPSVYTSRESILNAVVGFGYDVQTGGRLDIMAATAQTTFWSPPMLGSLDIGEKRGEVTEGRTVNLAERRQVQSERSNASRQKLDASDCGPRLRALIRQQARSLFFYDHAEHKSKAALPPVMSRTAVAVSGQVHSAGLYATRQDIQSLAAVAGPVQSFDQRGSQRMSLHAGATLLWEIDPESEAKTSLRLSGSLPVRVVSFDRYHGLLADEVLEAEAASTYELHADAAHISLTALNPGDGRAAHERVVGWHSDSSLIQVTHKAFLGEGAVIIPQASQWIQVSRRRSRLGRKVNHGLVTGRDLVARNIVKAASDQSQGWIETLMPSSVRVVVMLFGPAPGQAQEGARSDLSEGLEVMVRLLAEDENGTRVEYSSLKPSDIVVIGRETCALFTIPRPELQASQRFLRVRVQASDRWTQRGVLGMSEGDAQGASTRLSELRLEPRGVSLAETEHMRALIEMETTF